VDAAYPAPVSFGIRRCEFDHYLLNRAAARVRTGVPLSSVRRDGSSWIVNESVRAPMIVGAAGHFCPVARMLNGATSERPLVIAQEAEFPIDSREAENWPIAPERPELYFSRELDGYGWCLRKGQHVNVGFGCLSRRRFPEARAAFVAFLRRTGRAPDGEWRWRGHAYYLSAPARRRVVDAGVVLAGDAAGLAYPQSGEGIRPAIESGLMAASAILESHGVYTSERLAPYGQKLQDRFGAGRRSGVTWPNVPASLSATLGRWLLRRPRFVRKVVIDRWFLHAQVAPLVS
jgi:flavin-dependent dehydrogenase